MSLRRTDLKIRIALLTAVGALAATPMAAAQEAEVVPPDNSAVNQYTETYPTGGGGRDVHKGERNDASPNQVLGSRNTKRLEEQGAEGQAAAEVAAETAPTVPNSQAEPSEAKADEAAAAPPPSGSSGNGGNGADGRTANDEGQAPAPRQGAGPAATATDSEVDVPAGSSGVSEVLAQATGSTSSGELGLLLPLVILAALGWAVVLLLRRPGRAIR